MTTEFISMLEPPGSAIAKYDCSKPSSEQPSSIPSTFCEAMSIREEVFVKEQGVPLENELDADDPRSFHWVAYASVGTHGGSPPPAYDGPGHRKSSSSSSAKDEERRKSESTASRVAVGCIRLVPPPHPPNPYISHDDGNGAALPNGDHTLHRSEPYVKLGRLATLPQFRKMGLSRLLIKAALDYAAAHPDAIVPPLSPAELEKQRLEGRPEAQGWKGLVVIHAQTQVQGFWEKYGFKVDEVMGTWDEEGIEHVGMWRRIPVRREKLGF